MQTLVGVGDVFADVHSGSHVGAEDAALENGLPVALTDPFFWPVGSEHYQWDALKVGFGHCWRIVVSG